MKTIRLLVLALVISLAVTMPSIAQTVDSNQSVKSVQYIYCELFVSRQKVCFYTRNKLDRATNKDFTIINFGDTTVSKLSQETINRMTKQIESFNSMIDCLNYMSEEGWEEVDRVSDKLFEGYVQHITLKKIKQQ